MISKILRQYLYLYLLFLILVNFVGDERKIKNYDKSEFMKLATFRPCLIDNGIIPIDLIACAASSCIYRVCHQNNCDLAMKIIDSSDIRGSNQIIQKDAAVLLTVPSRSVKRSNWIGASQISSEVLNYKLASNMNIVPFLSYLVDCCQSEKRVDRGLFLDTNSEKKASVLLTDIYPMTLFEYLEEKKDRTTLMLALRKLRSRVEAYNFYHGDLHLHNLMVGYDLLDDSRREKVIKMLEDDKDYLPVVMIDLEKSSFKKDPFLILREWSDLFDYIRNVERNEI